MAQATFEVVSPEESIRAARSANERINAFTFLESESDLPQRESGPLAGVPIALKDLIDQKGRTTTCGSAFYRKEAEKSAAVVTRLEEAGGVIIGRTGLHEFAFGFSSENPHFGPVRNPWDPSTSAGGSSGGSGAAVGAGLAPIAVGTDTGGSVRVPAALCGCYGLKVTYGAVPLDGVFPLVGSIDTVGPLADSMANLETAYRVMAADDGPLPAIESIRFGVPQPWYEEAPMADDVRAAFVNAVNSLRELGHQVHPIQIPDVRPDRRIIFALAKEVQDAHRDFREKGLEYGDEVRERLDGVFDVTDEQAAEGQSWQGMIRDRFTDAFATVDFLLTPTVPAMRKVIGEDLIGGTHYRTVLSWFTAIVNHALLPAIALPLSGTGAPPVSIQVMGPRGGDLPLLSLGRKLEDQGLVGFTPASSE